MLTGSMAWNLVSWPRPRWAAGTITAHVDANVTFGAPEHGPGMPRVQRVVTVETGRSRGIDTIPTATSRPARADCGQLHCAEFHRAGPSQCLPQTEGLQKLRTTGSRISRPSGSQAPRQLPETVTRLFRSGGAPIERRSNSTSTWLFCCGIVAVSDRRLGTFGS